MARFPETHNIFKSSFSVQIFSEVLLAQEERERVYIESATFDDEDNG